METGMSLALSREAKITLLVHWFFQLGSSMSGVFLNLYLWRLTHSVWISGMYQIVFYAVTPFAFVLGGKLAKKFSLLIVYRVGIGGTVLFYLAVVLAGDRVIAYAYGFAVVQGIAQSLYLTGYLTLMHDVSNESNRVRYMSINQLNYTIANLLGPAAAGWLIIRFGGLDGYRVVFLIGFALFCAAAGLSFLFKSRRSRRKTFYMGHMRLIFAKDRLFVRSLWAFLLFGLLQGIMLFLPQLLLFSVLGQEDRVGYFSILFSLLGIGTGLVMSRYAVPSKLQAYVLAAGAGYVFGASFLLGGLSFCSVLIFLVCYAVGNALQGSSMNAYYYGLISKLPLKGELRIEALVMREPFVNLGRVVAIGFWIAFAADMQSLALPVVLITVSALQVVIATMVRVER